MDWLEGINSIVETLKDWIMTALEYTVFAVLYYIEVALAWILSLVESLLEIFTGEKDVLYAGDSTALVNVFFNHSSVRTIYTAIGLIGIVFAFAFATVAVIRKVLDLRGKQQGVTLGTILGNLLKSILLIGGMNAIVLVALTTTNVLVGQLSYSFTHSHQLAQAKKITFDDEEYAAMLRILNTVGNYSVNPSYRSRYNLNACYNDIRADLKYLGEKGVFDFHYVNEKDADGNELVTWQSLMESLGNAYNYSREVTLNSYDESLTSAILDVMETIRVYPTLEVLSEYENPSVDMEKGEDLALERMLIMLGTMGSVNGTAAARNDAFNHNPSLYDNVRLPFYTGEKSIYNYKEILDVFYTDPYHMNYLNVYVVTLGLIMEMIVLVLNCAVRIFNLVALYVIAPLAISSMPLDDGGKFKQWTTAFVIQLLSVVGTVISIRLFFVFLPIIWSPELTIGGNALIDGFVKCILMYASISAVNKVNGIFTGILADNAGYQAVMAGDMKQDFEGSAVGRVLGKATGRMKSFGMDKLADAMEGKGGGGGGEKKEGDGEKKQPDPKKAQESGAKQAAQNRKDYNRLKADYAHAQKTGHHATGSGKKLKAGELDKMGKTLKHMEQGRSLKDATKLAEADMKREKQQQKQTDAAEKKKNQTPPPDRDKAKKAAGKMNQNDYERMKSDYNYAKENGKHLTNDKKLKNGELDQMKETLDQYESMHTGQSGADGGQADSGSGAGGSDGSKDAGGGETPQNENKAGVQSDGGSQGSQGSQSSQGSQGTQSNSGAGSSDNGTGGKSADSGKSSGSGEVPQNESKAGVQSDGGSQGSQTSQSSQSSQVSEATQSNSGAGSSDNGTGGNSADSGKSSGSGEVPQNESKAGVQSKQGR